VQIRTKNDEDVRPYVKDIEIKWLETELTPDLAEIKKNLGHLIKEHAQKLAHLGFPPPLKSKRDFMALHKKIISIDHNIKYPALMHYAALLNLQHMQELAETQGTSVLRAYLEKFAQKETKSAKLLNKKPES